MTRRQPLVDTSADVEGRLVMPPAHLNVVDLDRLREFPLEECLQPIVVVQAGVQDLVLEPAPLLALQVLPTHRIVVQREAQWPVRICESSRLIRSPERISKVLVDRDVQRPVPRRVLRASLSLAVLRARASFIFNASVTLLMMSLSVPVLLTSSLLHFPWERSCLKLQRSTRCATSLNSRFTG